MGREVKRVSRAFDWELNKTWWGYTLGLSFYVDCGSCSESKDPKCHQCYGERYVDINPKVEPDYGQWYQMWEDTSDGSPISPPFETPEELAKWLADTRASTFGDMTGTYDQWLATINTHGGSIGMMFSPETGLISGVEAMGNTVESEESNV